MRLQQRLLKRLHQLGFFVELVIVAAVLFWSLDQDPETGIYAVATAAVFSATTGLAYLWFASRGVRTRRSD